ncbi:MAG: type II secretion system F family protein [Candidatus Margulisbacteria bacterium]|nr:type II secretion system F family protein [Candidatus Margulisiibacteriota bacterium]
MTSFIYKARDRYGVLTSGRLESDSSRGVAIQLGKQGFTPITITAEEVSGVSLQLGQWLATFHKIKPEELVVFTRQLASTLEAGVPLINSLDAVAEQIRDTSFRKIVIQVKKDIEGGATFSDALDKYHAVFSTLVVNMIRAGEKAGILPSVLDRVSNLLEKEIETMDKVKTATRYPMIVFGALGGAFIIMNIFVIPKFATFFGAFKTELPLPTRILMGLNSFMNTFWYWILGAIIGLIWFGKKILDTEKGRYNWDRFILSTPIFGSLFSKIYLSRFGRMLAAMLGSGIPILEALTVTAATVENKVISKVIINIRNEVSQGKSLAEPMKGSRVFPPIAIAMVAIGEKAGTMENMLNKTADYFDREVDYTIANLTPLLEPIMILCLAGMLLIFALGIFLPMWDLIKIYNTT